jgi:hypothetical protein
MFSILQLTNKLESNGPRRGQGVIRIELVAAEICNMTVTDVIKAIKASKAPFHAIVFEGDDSLSQINNPVGQDLLDALTQVFNVPMIIESNTTSFVSDVFVSSTSDLSFTHIIDIKDKWLDYFLDRTVGNALYTIYKNVKSNCNIVFKLPTDVSESTFDEIQRFVDAFKIEMLNATILQPTSKFEHSKLVYDQCMQRGMVLDNL